MSMPSEVNAVMPVRNTSTPVRIPSGVGDQPRNRAMVVSTMIWMMATATSPRIFPTMMMPAGTPEAPVRFSAP